MYEFKCCLSIINISCKYLQYIIFFINIFYIFLEGLSKNESYQKYTCEALDFKGEAVAFKATSSGIIEILKHCIDVSSKN